MEKPAPVDYPIHHLLARRWSPRAFSDRLVEPQKLCVLLEAARWAASSFNQQPWRFIVATRENADEFEKMLSCLVEGNVAWAKRAPVLMLTVAEMDSERAGGPNRHSFHDVGCAVANISIQAAAMDIFVHSMAGILPDKAREVYSIPKGFEPITALALGYSGDPSSLPDELRSKETRSRTRKPLHLLAFGSTWGVTSPVVSGS